MNGSIPQGVRKLANLNLLSLDNNYWEGGLSQNHLQGLTNLQSLRISSSNKSLIFNMSHEWVPPFGLTDITIRNSRLGPRYPAWPSSQKQLSSIRLTDVAISETIPFGFQSYLHRFFGSVPMNIDQMMLSLKALDLSGNFLNGSITLSIELCGPPLSTKCLMPDDNDTDGNQHAKAHKDEDDNENLGFYLGIFRYAPVLCITVLLLSRPSVISDYWPVTVLNP
ncbi:hypothetical protein HYC85_008976 [Camellia sinensis]|uniref:Uncharacterized protein n=1 Tax=Camellia sinensis TaxID=4442 RepID=A0A7J7HTG4_CAMSI|nr:hypothetical protein HYC85_008976 [Camellia sinensis]